MAWLKDLFRPKYYKRAVREKVFCTLVDLMQDNMRRFLPHAVTLGATDEVKQLQIADARLHRALADYQAAYDNLSAACYRKVEAG